MRLRWLVVLLLVALQIPALGAGWVTFSNPNPPFAIQYPAEWVRISADKVALLVLVAPGSNGLGLVVVGVPIRRGESMVRRRSTRLACARTSCCCSRSSYDSIRAADRTSV